MRNESLDNTCIEMGGDVQEMVIFLFGQAVSNACALMSRELPPDISVFPCFVRAKAGLLSSDEVSALLCADKDSASAATNLVGFQETILNLAAPVPNKELH